MFNPTKCVQSLGSYQKWAIGNDIRAILMADADVTNQIGKNIYPLVAPENTYGDFIVYERHKYTKDVTNMGVVEDVCQLALYCICDNYDNAVKLAQNIDNALTGTHKNEDNQRITISLEDSTESFEDMKYIEYLLFTIK